MSITLAVRAVGGGADDAAEHIPLRHGADVRDALAAAGWHEVAVLRATRPAGRPADLTIEVEGVRGDPRPAHEPLAAPQDPDLTIGRKEIPVEHQRVAAYAIVVEAGAVLLTQLSEKVRLVPGWWNLPGGGLETGEDPVDGLVREVWEETDQSLEPGELVDVHTQHWLGRSPSGRLEDFHAVRLIYSGRVRSAHEPVIHDIGGSTAAARWVPLSELDDLPLVTTVSRLRDAGHL